MNKKKVIIASVAVIGVGTAIYFIFRKDKSSKVGAFIGNIESKFTDPSHESYTPTVSTSTTTVNKSNYTTESFPLARGMGGVKVKNVQTILNQLYLDKIGTKLTVDGKFGPATEAALVKATGKKTLTLNEYNSLASASQAGKTLQESSGILDVFDPFGIFH